MLELYDVTLCCVDTRTVNLARYAIERCLSAARFGDAIFLGPQGEQAQHPMPTGVRWIDTAPLKGIQDYNRIILRELLPHVHTSHVLVVQWDGFITHPELWRQEFLSVDYIGSPWFHGGHPGKVGNGGFSLRSRRLLEALASLNNLDTNEPEDMVICEHRRAELEQMHGIRFASLAMAQEFGCEYGRYRESFGFHGMHNFAHIMNTSELKEWTNAAPAEILSSRHTRNLIKSLSNSKRENEAINLSKARMKIKNSCTDEMMLILRSTIKKYTNKKKFN